MTETTRGTLLHIPLIEERYGHAFVISIFLHILLALVFLVAPFLFPRPTPILIGTGAGGGSGAQYTVGVAHDLGGGEGMIKPSLIPKPPPLPVEKPVNEE